MFQQNGYNYDVEMMKHLVDDQVCVFVVSKCWPVHWHDEGDDKDDDENDDDV